MSALDKVIVAFDFSSQKEVENFLLHSRDKIRYVKVGMQLFYKEGPTVVKWLKQQGLKVFLDLKIHDIPNTAAGALSSLLELEVDMTNLHSAGGVVMMKKASEAAKQWSLRSGKSSPLLIGVTVLTSWEERSFQEELKIHTSLNDTTLHYAQLAKDSGLQGVVASAHEVTLIKEKLGKDFITVTPGIRLASDSNQDQKRVMTPYSAWKQGSDYLVMGRSITQAPDLLKAIEAIEKDYENAFS